MDPSDAKLAQALNDLASPVVVDCVECGAAIVISNRAKLYCSEVCRQTLKVIHYGRGVVADGRIERDPTIEEALQMRIAQILGDGYHEGLRRVPPALSRIAGAPGRSRAGSASRYELNVVPI